MPTYSRDLLSRLPLIKQEQKKKEFQEKRQRYIRTCCAKAVPFVLLDAEAGKKSSVINMSSLDTDQEKNPNAPWFATPTKEEILEGLKEIFPDSTITYRPHHASNCEEYGKIIIDWS